jgi:hypothetical protein
MARVHYETRLAAERSFQHRVDIPVPLGGLGNRLNEMLVWCRANIAAGEWDQHGRSEKALGQVPIDFARFYFMTGADADLFRWRWLKQ